MSLSYGDLSAENLRLATLLLRQEAEVQRHRRRLKALGLDPGPHHGSDPRPAACLRPHDQCGHLFHCPVCGAGSASPGDAEHHYCGRCGYVGTDGVTDEAQLRAELENRTREWQAEQASRIEAEERAVQAEQQRDAMHRMLERVPQVHMKFGVVGVVEPEDAPCADWCYACHLDRAKASMQRVQDVADAMRGTPGTRAWGERLDAAITGTPLRPGLRVHELRTARGWSLVELADAAGLTRETVRNIETGDTTPLPESLDALADALGVPRTALDPPEEETHA